MSVPSSASPDPGHPATTTDDDSAKARAAVRAGVLAYFVDQFDIYLPIIVLAPAAIFFQAADLSPSTSALLAALVFASTLIARPLGAAVFGHFADTTGRKKATLIAVAGFGITTLLIAALPGYQHIGMWSVALLIALRFVDGFFLGGEYTTAVPLAMEWSPKRRRGLVSGAITCTSPAAYAVIALLTLILLQILPSAGLDSAYVQWGWRIPFVIGVLLSAVLFWHYLHAVEEPPTERTAVGSRSPLMNLFTGSHRRALLQVFVLMTGAWLVNNMVSAVMPGLLRSRLGLSATQTTVTLMIEAALVAATYPLFGILSQRIGRRSFYISYGIVMAVLGSVAYALLMTLRLSYGGVLALVIVLGVCTIGVFGPIAAYLTERFPARIRASGYGVGYSLALIIPAFYGFYLAGLDELVPAYVAPVLFVALSGVLVAVGGWLGPETRDVDMRAVSDPSAVPPSQGREQVGH